MPFCLIAVPESGLTTRTGRRSQRARRRAESPRRKHQQPRRSLWSRAPRRRCSIPSPQSIATQTLIILAIRTRGVPFLRSRPSAGLLAASLGVVAAGVYLPLSPLADVLGL